MPDTRIALVTGATAGLGRAVMNLATGPAGGAVTGRYFDGMNEARAHEGTYDLATRSRLRTVTAELLAPFLTGSDRATA
jgi:NADP-dependent 3-hydroxy acid dehydrogenase YdfG